MRASSLLAVLVVGALVGEPLRGDDGVAAWTPPAGSRIEFVGRNLVSTAEGVFHRWRVADARIAPGDPAASFVVVEVDVASLDTGIALRDEHLRGTEFFAVDAYPTAEVRVSDVRRTGDPGALHYAARFDVRIRDARQTLEGGFDVVSESPLVVRGALTLSRSSFGVGAPPSTWNPLAVDDEVDVSFVAALDAHVR